MPVVESSPEDLATQRYLLDLALQPLDRFDGFTRLEQIGLSALRYQLNYVCYALAMAQYTRTPAFGGYLAEAQANTIRKMCDKRVWGYWAAERLLGYGRWNPDPMVFGNVMYTGFFAAMLAFYETLNGDRSFDADGSLPLVRSRRRRYDYGFTKIAEAIRRNMHDSAHTLYPCEPHLIYPMCNTIALNGLQGYDRLHGTDLTGDLAERMRDSFHRHRYLLPTGRFRPGLGPLGIKFSPALSNDAIMAYWLDGVMPDLAERTWGALRDSSIHIDGGVAQLKTRAIDRFDAGSYRRSDAWTWLNIFCAAKEMGDDDVVKAVDSGIEERFVMDHSPAGARKLAGQSTWTNCVFALAQFVHAGSLRGLANGDVPQAWRTGPLLSTAAYPAVLVAKAITDGAGLELVLRPGAGPVQTALEISRLQPGHTYRVTGARDENVTADSHGRALVNVSLCDRLEVALMYA